MPKPERVRGALRGLSPSGVLDRVIGLGKQLLRILGIRSANRVVTMRRQRRDRTSVLIADPLALPIAKGIAGPGLLAETVVKRWF